MEQHLLYISLKKLEIGPIDESEFAKFSCLFLFTCKHIVAIV
jgi:hypothetical protein